MVVAMNLGHSPFDSDARQNSLRESTTEYLETMALDCPLLDEDIEDLIEDLELQLCRFDPDLKVRIRDCLKLDWNARCAGTTVKKCRFANWVDRAQEYDRSFTFTKMRVQYYGLQERLFSKDFREKLAADVMKAAAAEADSAQQLGRVSMANSNDAVKKLREANKSNVQLTATLLSDPLCRPRMRLLWRFCAPIREWYGKQNRRLRSCHEHREFMQTQVHQHFAEPLRATWRLLADGRLLGEIGLQCDLNPMLMQCNKDDPVVAYENALAATCGAYVVALLSRRSRRMLYLTHGWTGQQALFTSNDERCRQVAADKLMGQFRAFEKATTRRETFWKNVVKRSIFKYVATEQLVEFLKRNGGQVSDAMRAHCVERISGIGQSKVAEDEVGVGRGREHSAHNKSQIPPRRLWESYVTKGLPSTLYRYAEPEWQKMPLPAGREGFLPKSLFTTQFKSVPKWIPQIIGTNRKATTFFTTDVEGSCAQFADLDVLTAAMDGDNWSTIAKAYFMGSLCDGGGMALLPPHTAQWYISLGSVSGPSVLAWPAEAVHRSDGTLQEFRPQLDGHAEILCVTCGYAWQAVNYVWTSPLSQVVQGLVPPADSLDDPEIRMVVHDEPECLWVFAAKSAFWCISFTNLGLFCRHLGIEVSSEDSMWDRLFRILKHLLSDHSEEEIVDIMKTSRRLQLPTNSTTCCWTITSKT